MKKSFLVCVVLLISIFSFSISVIGEAGSSTVGESEINSLSQEKVSQIESWIRKNMKDGKIPGASIVIVKGDKTVYNKGFGYSDVRAKKSVTQDTLFELGSTSKAFTALGILKLEKEGLVNLNDSVNKYIPWLKMKYSGNYRGKKIDGFVNITLSQLLHHTSGIPSKAIGDIPVSEGEDALEKTVRTQVSKKLDFYPGEKFLYSTINYDILGLVIKNVSGQSYEQYVKSNILQPLGLGNTYLFRNEVPKEDMSWGYKVKFLRPEKYDAPMYRGNTPAGYYISNAVDIAKWLKIQMNAIKPGTFDKSLIDISHIPDRTVAPNSDGSSYAYGWSVFQSGGGIISHGGSNPNYSSYFLFRPLEQVGVGILANLNSSYTEEIAYGIDNIIRGEKPVNYLSDQYLAIDNASTTITLIALPVALVTFILILLLIIQIVKRQRFYAGKVKKVIISTLFMSLFISGLGYCMYKIPDALYEGLPWGFIKVWAPQSLLIGISLLIACVTIFCIYFLLTSIFVKKKDKSWFVIAVLSIVSGFGNAIVIFIINEALNRTDGFQSGLLLFFVLGIALYVYGQRLVRVRLLKLTNELVYNTRMNLIDGILKAPYEKIEQLENGKIHAGLNNDSEVLSNFANVLISAITSLVTLFCCFIYLGIINIYGLLVSVFVIFIAAGLYFVVGRHANKLWEETRDIQNVFFKFINSLVSGFKELKLHNKRQHEFRADMKESCKEYKDKRIRGDLGFANAFVIGELLFTLVIGVVAFVFPVLFKDIQIGSLRNYIFVFLYMTGPVNGALNSIPQIIGVRISYKRLNDLKKELECEEEKTASETESDNKLLGNSFDLELKNVEYSYKNSDGELFKVGPINCSFKSGEVTFITGGNGSGKSTLAKLVTGLYKPDSGEALVNRNVTEFEALSQNYSTVFSDYFLFDKLYGINYKEKSERMQELLKILHIDDKLSIDNGVFSTTKLSSGQRKRLALLVSYLEDREIYLFDEWAADQDPEFRKYFYEYLLSDLKARGKCVIAVTHDDRYFDRADKIIKMEMGKIAQVASPAKK